MFCLYCIQSRLISDGDFYAKPVIHLHSLFQTGISINGEHFSTNGFATVKNVLEILLFFRTLIFSLFYNIL